MRTLNMEEMDHVAGGQSTDDPIIIRGKRNPNTIYADEIRTTPEINNPNNNGLLTPTQFSFDLGSLKDVLKALAGEKAQERQGKYAADGTDKQYINAKEVKTIKDEANGKTYQLKDGFYQLPDGRIMTDSNFDGILDLQVKASNGALFLDRDANGSMETNSNKMLNPVAVFNT